MSHKTLPGVRIVLDLESFFKDKRIMCYHYIDFSRNRIVGDVCNDIKSNFELNTDIFLEMHNCYVPEKQDVRIFYDEDVVSVIDAGKRALTVQNDTSKGQRHVFRGPEILTNTLSDQKCGTMHNQAVNESDENVLILSKSKKRKKSRTVETQEKAVFNQVDLDEDENPKRKKKSKKSLPNSISTEHEYFSHSKSEKEPDALSTMAVLTDLTSKDKSPVVGNDTKVEPEFTLKTKKRTEENVYNASEELPHEQTCEVDTEGDSIVSSATNIKNGERQDILPDSKDHADESGLLDSNLSKKRRRRRRKKSQKINHDFSEQVVIEFPVHAKSSFKTPQHIKFEDEEEPEDFSNNTKPNISDNNAVKRESESSATDTSSTKNVCNVKSGCDVPLNSTANGKNSDISHNFVIQTSNTPMIFECKRTNKVSSNQTVSKETETDFSKYPVMNETPKVNDIIAFKKLKMDANYCPSISHYISAKVLQVNEKDNSITLRILNGHEELKEPKGKFSLEEENEDDYFEEKIVNDAEMNLAELLDIRLLFP